MNVEELINIRDYYLDENNCNKYTRISSSHCPIFTCLDNATDEEIMKVKEFYIQYERDYANPINKVKKLIRKITRV